MISRRTRFLVVISVLLAALGASALFGLSDFPWTGTVAYAEDAEGVPVKVLILSKFEIGDIEGDFPGEAQLFYEHYCAGCEEIAVPNAPPTSHFYFNQENGVGLLLTGAGKTAAGLSLMSLLGWNAYGNIAQYGRQSGG